MNKKMKLILIKIHKILFRSRLKQRSQQKKVSKIQGLGWSVPIVPKNLYRAVKMVKYKKE